MLSVPGSMLQAFRQTWSRWPSSSRMPVVVHSRHNTTSSLNDLNDLVDAFKDAGNDSHQPEGGQSAESQSGIDFSAIDATNAKSRYFGANDFFPPNALSRKALTRQYQWRKPAFVGPSAKESRQLDNFYQLGIDPLREATNSRLLSDFVTEMGKIKSRAETKLTWRSQRRLGKAIRRAKAMGIIPYHSRRDLDFGKRT